MKELLLIALLTPVRLLGEGYQSYQGPLGVPLAIYGPPGIGKTDQVEQVAHSLGMLYHAFPIESCETEDLNGVVVRTESGGLERLSDNKEFLNMIEAGEGVLSLDELNSNRGLAASINRVIHERIWCRRQLPRGIRILSTLNPTYLSAGGRALPASQANRLCHIDAPAHSTGEWLSYMSHVPSRKATLSQEDFRKKLATSFDANRASILAALTGFFRATSTKPQNTPEEGSPHLSRSWPSERTWHMSINMLATALALGHAVDVATPLLEGLIGEDTAKVFMTYYRNLDLPSLEEVLAGRWTPRAHRLDVTYVVLSSVLTHLRSPAFTRGIPYEDKLEQLSSLLTLADNIASADAKDMVVELVRTMSPYLPVSKLSSGTALEKELTTRLLRLTSGWDPKLYKAGA